jgi:hypothetical protein
MHVFQMSSFITGDSSIRYGVILKLPDLVPLMSQYLPFVPVKFSASGPMPIPTLRPGGSNTKSRYESNH